ncbi:unnamed protein product, partial [Choristocarpus tenellus]
LRGGLGELGTRLGSFFPPAIGPGPGPGLISGVGGRQEGTRAGERVIAGAIVKSEPCGDTQVDRVSQEGIGVAIGMERDVRVGEVAGVESRGRDEGGEGLGLFATPGLTPIHRVQTPRPEGGEAGDSMAVGTPMGEDGMDDGVSEG